MKRVNNPSGRATTAHISHWSEDSRVDKRRWWGEWTPSCWLWVWGMLHNTTVGGRRGRKDGGGCVCVGDFLPRVPWSELMLPQGWAGPFVTLDTIRGAGPENPPRYSLHHFSSLSGAQSQHVHTHCTYTVLSDDTYQKHLLLYLNVVWCVIAQFSSLNNSHRCNTVMLLGPKTQADLHEFTSYF